MIDAMIDKFDFKKVQKSMIATDSGWIDTEGLPSIVEMKKTARAILEDVSKKNVFVSSRGGFVAIRDKDDMVTLRYVVTETYSTNL